MGLERTIVDASGKCGEDVEYHFGSSIELDLGRVVLRYQFKVALSNWKVLPTISHDEYRGFS